MREPKNILLIIPNLDFGGAQNSFCRLSVELGKMHSVTNVVFNKDHIADYPLGGALIDLQIGSSTTLLGKVISFIKRLNKVKAIKRKYKIDTAISFLEGADYINILSRQNEKIIVNVRGSKRFDQNISGWIGFVRHKFLLPWFYNRADQLVALNMGIKEELRFFYKIKKPIRVVYNAFDSAELENLSMELIEENLAPIFNEQVIISHGRLSIEKGYDQFVRAFSLLIKEGNRCKFILIGDGPEKGRIISVCQLMGLTVWEVGAPINPDADVFFLGYKKNPYKYLKQALLFVLPSHHEGFGNSLAEAMICGLPAIASDCPYSPREILSLKSAFEISEAEWSEFGILIPTWKKPIAAEQWAITISKLLRHEELRLQYSERAKLRMNDFTVPQQMKTWKDLILS